MTNVNLEAQQRNLAACVRRAIIDEIIGNTAHAVIGYNGTTFRYTDPETLQEEGYYPLIEVDAEFFRELDGLGICWKVQNACRMATMFAQTNLKHYLDEFAYMNQ